MLPKKYPIARHPRKGNMLLSYSNRTTLSDALMTHSCQTASNFFLKHPKVWAFIPEQKSRLCESRYIEIQPQQSKQSNPGMSFLTQKVQCVRGSKSFHIGSAWKLTELLMVKTSVFS